MVLTNKSLASSYKTNFNLLLVVFQAVFAIGCCEAAKAAGYITYPKLEKVREVEEGKDGAKEGRLERSDNTSIKLHQAA